ncbi:MAG TPA: hypothetical protein VKU00_29230, partial [Chthonomonadaceae bacterium]|nr:hypothetical protein [Chthonomonadaceae bacterium]
GAKGVYGFISDNEGFPITIGLGDVSLSHLSEKEIAAIRQAVLDEFARVASWKDGSPELLEFNNRLAAHLVETHRYLSKALDTPPGFGARNSSSWWMDQLRELERSGTFQRSITQKPDLAYVEKLLASKRNFWRERLAEWELTGTLPYAIASRPSAALATREAQERTERIAAETVRLEQKYGVSDAQAALQRYLKDYNAATAEIDALAKQLSPPRFIDAPPLTLDDLLDYQTTTLPGGVPLVASTFDNMTGATTGLALRLDGVSEDQLLYLTLLPSLLTNVGVVESGKPLSYEEMQERLRREILALNASFSVNNLTGRYELIVRGSGNNIAETERAVGWMQRVLLAPDWRPENLPRIRDVVDQTLNGMRNIRQGPEESWVNAVAAAYRWQDRPLSLATSSFLTRTHSVQRLRWQLMDVPTPADRTAVLQFLDTLATAGSASPRMDLLKLLQTLQAEKPQPAGSGPVVDAFGKLPTGAKRVAVEAVKDLQQTLPDVPDDSLAADWAYLCHEMRADLSVTPEKALSNLNALRRSLLKQGEARLFFIGSTASRKRLLHPIQDLLTHLEPGKSAPATYDRTPRILARLRERVPDATKPIFVGLLNPNSQGGVFLNSAPGITYTDTEPESLLRYLAGNLYAGGGAHSVFMQTWGAGLAYSNGIGNSPDAERISYYAERCPELPQTLRFVIETLKKAPRDLLLTEYAIAQSFYSRAADAYEERGEAMAADLADGLTPDRVRHFRQAVLGLRERSDLSQALYDRMDAAYGRILPGYGVKMAAASGGVYFVIGAEKQFDAYEAYLKSVEGPETRLYRLAPRDFWLPAKL